MRLRRFLILIVLITYLCGCTKKTGESGKIIEFNTIEQRVIDTLLFSSFKKIKLKTDESGLSYLKKIRRISKDEGKYFILDVDLRKIVVYDTTGNYLNVIHDTGFGPREYQQVSDFFLDTKDKQILLLCTRPYKLMYYNYNGIFIKEVELEDAYQGLAMDTTSYYFKNFDSKNNIMKDYEIDTKGLKFEKPNSVIPFDKEISNRIEIPGNSITSSSKKLYYSNTYRNTIYSLNNGSATPLYTLDFKGHGLSEELKNRVKAEQRKIFDNAIVFAIKDVKESENQLLFRTNIGLFSIDKTKNTMIGYRIVSNDSYDVTLHNYLTVGNTEKEVAFIVEPSELFFLEKMVKDKKSKISEGFSKLLKETTPNDNPYLFVYDLK